MQQNALTAQIDQQLNTGGSDIQFFENGVQKFVSEDVDSMMGYENVKAFPIGSVAVTIGHVPATRNVKMRVGNAVEEKSTNKIFRCTAKSIFHKNCYFFVLNFIFSSKKYHLIKVNS